MPRDAVRTAFGEDPVTIRFCPSCGAGVDSASAACSSCRASLTPITSSSAAPKQQVLPVGMTAAAAAPVAAAPIVAVAARKPKRQGSSPIWTALAAVAVILLLGAGGWFGYQWWQDRDDGGSSIRTANAEAPASTTSTTVLAESAPAPVGRFRVVPGSVTVQPDSALGEVVCIPLTVTNEGGTIGQFSFSTLSVLRPSGGVSLQVDTAGGAVVTGELTTAAQPGQTLSGSMCWNTNAEQGTYTFVYDPQNDLSGSTLFVVGTVPQEELPPGL
jgi:hypothetical protein